MKPTDNKADEDMKSRRESLLFVMLISPGAGYHDSSKSHQGNCTLANRYYGTLICPAMADLKLSNEDCRRFDEDGVTVLRQVIDEGWRKRLAEAIERDIADPGPYFHGYAPEDGQGRFHGNLRVWENDETFRDFCFNSPLPALAQQFFGSKRISLHYDQLFVKEPGTLNRTRWHNDQPYWSVSGWQVMSFWVALDPTDETNGMLEFIRGSHKWGRWFQPVKFGDTNIKDYERNPDYELIPDIEADRDSYDILSWRLDPGDVLAFHAMTVHGAGGNRERVRRRRGYAVRYTGDDARYDPRIGTSAVLQDPSLVKGARMESDVYPLIIGG